MILKDCASIKGGKRLPKGQFLQQTPNNHPYIRVKDMQHRFVFLDDTYEYVPDSIYPSISRYTVKANDIILSIVGTVGLVAIVHSSLDLANLTENCVKIVNIKNYLPEYIYYFLYSNAGQTQIQKGIVGSTQPKLPLYNIERIKLPEHSIDSQQHIVDILGTLDEKIENNEKLIDKLEEKMLLEYDLLSQNCSLEETIMQDCFDISIGKTPPRKESKWFTTDKEDIKWLSISDLGKSKVFCFDSSEKLTPESIKRYNVKIVPENTVVLSFKLTVGKVAITACQMATNEAIAHFNTKNNYIVEYLYCYLKRYNFDLLGNTSSIATAVNSKTIKAMKFIKPNDNELIEFHNKTNHLLKKIKYLLDTNAKLNELKQLYLKKFFG